MNNEKVPEQFLILRLSALGDVIHTMPSVAALRAARPDALIRWVVEAPYAELVRQVAPVDEVIAVRTKRWRGNITSAGTWREIRETVRALRASRAGRNVSIDYQGLTKSAIWGAAGGFELRYGFAPSIARERLSALFTNERRRVTSAHVIDLNLALTAVVLDEPVAWKPLDFSRFAADEGGTLGTLTERRPVVLLAGTGRAEKVWPVESFRALARELTGRGYSVLAVWGPGEEEAAAAIAADGNAELAPATTLPQLASLLRSARLVIGGDTGPLHLADAMDVPVVGLFAPTDPERNGPYRQLDRVVSTFGRSADMRAIQPEVVSARALSLLA